MYTSHCTRNDDGDGDGDGGDYGDGEQQVLG